MPEIHNNTRVIEVLQQVIQDLESRALEELRFKRVNIAQSLIDDAQILHKVSGRYLVLDKQENPLKYGIK